jgi:hypothetical protein
MRLRLGLGVGGQAGTGQFPTFETAKTVWVSDVDFFGTPVGDDTTGTGTRTNPFRTLAKGYTMAPNNGFVACNGNPAAPTEYRHATAFQFNLAKNVRIESVAAYGAKITATTTSGGVITHGGSNQAGIANAVGKVTIDGRGLNNYGVATSTISTTPFTLTLDGTRIVDYVVYGVAASTTTATHPVIIMNSVSIEATGARFCIFHGKCSPDSSITINGGSFRNVLGQYGYGWLSVTGTGISAPQIAINGGTFYRSAGTSGAAVTQLIEITDAVAKIRGATFRSDDPSGKSAGGEKVIVFTPSTGGAGVDMAGCEVAYCVFDVDALGGGVIWLGHDGTGTAPYTAADDKLNNIDIYLNTIRGSAQFAALGSHAIFISDRSNAHVYDNDIDRVGIALVDKNGLNALWERNRLRRVISSYMIAKGSTGSTFQDQDIEISAGYLGAGMDVETNPSTGVASSGIKVRRNAMRKVGTTAGTFINIDAGQGVALDHNSYFPATAGNEFRNLGVVYPNFAAYQAGVEPTALAA